MFTKIRNKLRNSAAIHIRDREVSNLKELVDLLDRFLYGKLNYPLEWDDFISWENSVANVEAVRSKLAELEPLLFSKERSDRDKGISIIKEERNRLALMFGYPKRY